MGVLTETRDIDSVGIGKRIKQIREAAQLNKQKFAKELALSPAYVTYLELGVKGGEPTNPSNRILETISHRFGVSSQWLKNGTGAMQSSYHQRILAKLWDVKDDDLKELHDLIDDFLKRKRGE